MNKLKSDILNKKSGVLGLSDNFSSDFRDLAEAAAAGNERAATALEAYAYRVGKYNFSGIKNLTENLARQESNPRQLIEMIRLLVKNSNELDDRFAGWLISLDIPYHQMPC